MGLAPAEVSVGPLWCLWVLLHRTISDGPTAGGGSYEELCTACDGVSVRLLGRFSRLRRRPSPQNVRVSSVGELALQACAIAPLSSQVACCASVNATAQRDACNPGTSF